MHALTSCETTDDGPPAWVTHQDALLARALRLCGDAEIARDLVQDTYLRALSREAHFAAGTNAGAWLFTILRRLFIDEWRRRQRATHVSLTDALMEAEPEALATAPAADEDDELWARISAPELEAAIETLGPSFRSVLRLHAVEQRSYREIGAHLGIPTATVGSRLARARRKLEKVLRTG